MPARRRSSFFFLGRLDPPELANFNVQNVFLPDRDARLEVFGHTIAIWWPDRRRDEFDDLLDGARDWFGRVAAAYFLETEVALEPAIVGWVEALDVVTQEAMIGVIDPRFLKIRVVEESDPRNEPMRRAIEVATRLRGTGELERATTELLSAANDPTEQAFLSAFRSLECVRRIYEPDWDRRDAGWTRLRTDLEIAARKPHEYLAAAASAIRHGDVPPTRNAEHAVNHARKRRDELMAYARSVVSAAVKKHAPSS